jgi:undecaprenyl-diphosphatase
VWYRSRLWGFWYFVVVAAVGVARIYTGVHWPLDVIGGAIIGIACAAIIHALFRKTRKALYEPSSASE